MGLLDESIGSAFIGSLLAAIFFGVTCLQAVIYFTSNPPDRRIVKSLVLAVLLLDTLHMILVTSFIYTLIVDDFGNSSSMQSAPWSLGSSFLVSLISDTIIRCFFARRVWCLTGKNWSLVALLAIPIILAFGVSLSSTINVIVVSLGGASSMEEWLMDFSLISSMGADFSLTATLSFIFYMSKSEYFGRTNKTLNALCKYTINTGLIATIWTLCCIIANAAKPSTYVALIFYLPLSKVYTNAFLGSLNVRDSLREMSKTKFFAPSLFVNSRYADHPMPSALLKESKGVSIRVDSETEIYGCEYRWSRLGSRSVTPRSTTPSSGRHGSLVFPDSRFLSAADTYYR
ncbi:hypothetical protein SCHPADRAFT_902370 [Schizopora paradoxa]|uniref:DUF6534 domain-containing protein n=1 Tax=Schizopora paradoxa TaxID=27342 RepID=A0A0H2RUG8_9AGAM|nr:hypothetical protein SCHPADRAFT_902370 [Schizopora paradoxa]